MKLLIKGGRIIDPANNLNEILDLLVVGSKISRIGKNIQVKAAKLIDAKDKLIMPGLVDMHVHLREPGREDKETVESGTKAAAKGGVTSVLAMPNTEPAIDCPKSVKLFKDIITKKAYVNVFISAAITKGRFGKELTNIAGLKKSGVVAITDDGSSPDSRELMSEAFKKAAQEKVLIICHCEDRNLSREGVVNKGFTSTRLGLRGISRESEYERVARDIELAKARKASVHIAHLSCRESVEIVAEAKRKGIRVTAETAPHYFSLSEEDLVRFDTNLKMNPPLRNKKDISVIKKGLKDGTIDVIASDHAPHTENEKDIEFEHAEFGVIGLETELAVAITNLVRTAVLDWPDLVNKMAYNPAKILKIDKGTLGLGKQADIIVVSPHQEWVVQKKELYSKSKNSCFLGKKLKGLVEFTVCGGKIIYANVNKYK